MRSLQEVNNQQLLKEIYQRVKASQLTEKEIAKALAKAEAEAWKIDFELASNDEERNKEAEEWDNLEEDYDN